MAITQLGLLLQEIKFTQCDNLAISIPIYFSYVYLLLKTSCKTLFPDKVFIQKTLAEKQLR